MARLKPKETTIKALFAKSGNQCAFPKCEAKLINNKNQFIHNLRAKNVLERLRIDLIYIEIKFLEEFLKHNPNHCKAKSILEDRKKILKKLHKFLLMLINYILLVTIKALKSMKLLIVFLDNILES